jgi:hypothetical protein
LVQLMALTEGILLLRRLVCFSPQYFLFAENIRHDENDEILHQK